MTYLKDRERSYMIWSYRENIGKASDTGSMLYLAEVDENTPWRLKSDPVLLSRPLYGWENLEGTINNEGPYTFTADDTVYLAYSGGAANGYTYTVVSWRRIPARIFCVRSPGERRRLLSSRIIP